MPKETSCQGICVEMEDAENSKLSKDYMILCTYVSIRTQEPFRYYAAEVNLEYASSKCR